ncbi:Alkaline phosphatase synthesis sensor protein PhoR [compost metagenome]
MAGLWWLWLLVTAALLLLWVRERLSGLRTRKELAYINGKLNAWTAPGQPLGQERLLAVTADPELRELLRSVNALVDRARQSAADYARTEQAMRRMLSNVSHDLKTPLTVIMGYAEVLDRSPELSQEERQRMLGQVYRKTVEVHERINAFFDLSRLEADDYDLPLSRVDACEVCRRQILAYFDLLNEQGARVEINLPEEPAWMYANEEALSRILDNLLSNAVRYGLDGGYLGLSLIRDDSRITIEVADRGRGIAHADQALVFERMYTVDDSRSRSIQGSGLGLAIAKRLTERLGGSISVDSEPGRYTCFRLQFPSSPAK